MFENFAGQVSNRDGVNIIIIRQKFDAACSSISQLRLSSIRLVCLVPPWRSDDRGNETQPFDVFDSCVVAVYVNHVFLFSSISLVSVAR